ncbi:MAG TPA: 16S rRNA (guanine(527)-N(7))-methyltransferase RsmG [Burkholderiales bacterium]
MSNLASSIRQGVAGLGLTLPGPAFEQLENYLALLMKWNRVYNLTAIRDDAKLVSHHLLDSLAVVGHLPAGNLVDVGSGAGLPGIPIAISCPGRPVTLVDSNSKKGAFLKQAVTELDLQTVRVVTERAETFRPSDLFRIVISRAFSDLADFVKFAGHLCATDGVMVAMKGLRPDDELAKLPPSWAASKIVPLEIPQLGASRHLVFLRRLPITSPV